jgi:hypothetical protein
MLIETTIKPRNERTVRLVTAAGNAIVFADDGSGHLVADVTDQADLTFVLSLSEFSPLDEADFGQAESLILENAGANDTPDDLPDDDGDENAAPVEKATPPKPGKPAKAPK